MTELYIGPLNRSSLGYEYDRYAENQVLAGRYSRKKYSTMLIRVSHRSGDFALIWFTGRMSFGLLQIKDVRV